MTGTLHVLGVRHHSPACARRVEHVLTALRPRFVLIEGPVDFNDRIDELRLRHTLPVALFTYYQDAERAHASWTPFCDYSPEWVAIRVGKSVGADVRFMDLPAWSRAFAGVRNRYGDGERRVARYVDVLGEKLGIEGLDALWDHLFEQPMPVATLSERLDAYFDALRGADTPLDRDAMREAFMARCVDWALAQGGDVVVVCGGFHQPALERAARTRTGAESDYPRAPEPASGARHGTYLVPYSFRRLDSFVGYESGMPSPAFHQAVWEHGPDVAAGHVIRDVIGHLRKKGQHVSTADLVAASTLAEGLARLRGHSALARTDLLDGLAAALVKEGLDAPLPWTVRGTVTPGTDALLVEVLAALSGAREGRLAKGTPQPPLVADVESTLARSGLTPEETARDVKLDLAAGVAGNDLDRSRTLHRLRILGIPGFTRRSGPASAIEAELREVWSIVRSPDAPSALIEAAAWGATLEDAARSRLEEMLSAAKGHLARIAEILTEAVFAGLLVLAETMLESLGRAIGTEPSLSSLGSALSRLWALWGHDRLLGAAGSRTLAVVLEAGFDRGLWLVEGNRGKSAPLDEEQVAAVAALRDIGRDAGRLSVDSARLRDVMRRTAADPESPPSMRGAALGAMWSLGEIGGEADARAHAVTQIKAVALPQTLGDFLAGLFALAREEIVHAPELVLAVDQVVGAMVSHDFLVAVPSLRLAFSYFPPRERDAIARRVLRHHGGDPDDVRSLRRLGTDAITMTRAGALEALADSLIARYAMGRTP